jgi:tRNA-specific 2-thiouridylase
MSGGVDSSTVAALLVREGHRVFGLTMVLLPGGGERHLSDARAACAHLGIPHHALDLREEFRREVIEPFTASYLAGRTPNPCILCNSRLKFRRLLDKALALGADALATGHYARIRRPGRRSIGNGGIPGEGGRPDESGLYQLLLAADPAKDQSYFLFALGQSELARVLFPLGGMRKEEVRARAAALGLPVHDKDESQDACFLGEKGVRVFLSQAAGDALSPGPILDASGRSLGTHRGAVLYTVGQRKGLGVAGAEPRYVVRIDAAQNSVVLGTREEASSRTLSASGATWVAGAPPDAEFRATVRIRHRHHPAPAVVRVAGPAAFSAAFAEPQLGVAPGQAAVVYDGDEVLGGGWID